MESVDAAKDRGLSLDQNQYVNAKNANNAADVWKFQKNLYQNSGLERRIGLLLKLCSVQLNECRSV